MKRKLDVSELKRGSSASDDSDHINPWTGNAFSPRYFEILKKRQQLPVFEFKEELQSKVANNQVIIIEGETGMWILMFHSSLSSFLILISCSMSDSQEVVKQLKSHNSC